MNRTEKVILLTLITMSVLLACEKEIEVDVPPSTPQLVVEASINTRFPLLNYVFITQTIDYFKPDLSLNGIRNASVYITEGVINGTDTLYDTANRVQLIAIDTIAKFIPALDSLLGPFSGVYMNPLGLNPKANTAYKLEIFLPDGRTVTGKTFIPKIVTIDSVQVKKGNNGIDPKKNMYLKLFFNDGSEQNNYRMAVRNYIDSFLFGWGAADFYRTFDDQFVNNGTIPYEFVQPWEEGDTMNFYFTHIGRKEFLYWQSFGRAANNGGPFATPGAVKSNIEGAIGSFTGYAVDFKQVIMVEQ